MPDAVTLALAQLAACIGLGWFALSLGAHWRQVHDGQSVHGSALLLRALGTLALGAALSLCLAVDHVSMAALLWVMMLAAGALVVAFTLAWRPRWLAPLARIARARPG
jgi:hypothetical protein